MKRKKSQKAPRSPCCIFKMDQVEDSVYFHYRCIRCGKEYDLDGKTKWEDA